MKRKNREINIFSMSALDLFASAMGAFILIAVVALPYYLKTDKLLIENNKELTKQLKSTQESLAETKNALTECRLETSRLQNQKDQAEDATKLCKEKLKETFIAVVMQWPETDVDIDLHVTDPNGQVFYYKKHNRERAHYPNSRANLSRDTTRGPGVEVWEIPIAKQGRYRIQYYFIQKNGGASTAKVSGNIYTNKGNYVIPKTTLRHGQKLQVATVVIDGDGNVSFE